MKLLSRIRKLSIFTALVLTMLFSSAHLPSNGGGSPGEACAVTGYYYTRMYTYYSDASYTTEIGWRYLRCNGTAITSGSTSSYFTVENVDVCCGSYEC